ncbi:flavodoxin family protein [Streptomyces albus]|uniref:flavodoxin family protein n=1 Tax=Streptomyces albus TaxID=1888 RepID=UPI003F1DAF6A
MSGRPADRRTRPRIAVVYHSRRGTMCRLAAAAAEGAGRAGATVRLLRVADTMEDPFRPGPTVPAQPSHPVAAPEDVLWADGLVLATPTYFGNVSAPFKAFLDSTARLWAKGMLTDRVVTGMTSAECSYGGREATLLSLYQTAYHWGSWVLGAEPADDDRPGTGRNPYGLSAAYRRGSPPGPSELGNARALGHRLARITGRPTPVLPSVVARPTRVTVVHHAEGTAVRTLAQECAAGARDTGAQVRLRRVPDPSAGGPPADGAQNGQRHPERATAGWGAPRPPVVTTEDLAWADAVIFGAPSRLGTLSAPLLAHAQSLARTGAGRPLWGKAASAFTVTPHPHAGSESALLAFHHVLFHCGAVVVPPGYTDPASFAAGGNPYGVAHPLSAGDRPSPEALLAVRHQGRRTAMAGDRLRRTVPDIGPTSPLPAHPPAAPAGAGRTSGPHTTTTSLEGR